MLRFVPTPIGNIADITFRALEAIERAEVFLCEDTRVTKQLLFLLQERYNITLQLNKKFIPLHSHNEKRFFQNVDLKLFEKEVIYLSDAGMPGVSDPGAKLVAFAQSHGIAYDILPGSNAALNAYVASGFDATRFLFFGFLPHKGKERERELQEVLHTSYVVILYEAPHRLEKLLGEIKRIDPDRELFLAKELTKKFQTYYKGCAAEILEQIRGSIKGEWVVVLSPPQTSKRSFVIGVDEIMKLDIPKKQKAKLLAKITEKSVTEWYNSLL